MRLAKTSFRERFLIVNNLQEQFADWVFHPGMLFQSHEKWWCGGGVRARPHEGVDLSCYRDKEGGEHYFEKDTLVPVIYQGEIRKVGKDFIGESLFVAHAFHDIKGRRLHTVYGHVSAGEGMHKGSLLREGDILGTVATPGRTSQIPAHLHISVAFISTSLDEEHLNWGVMSDSDMVSLVDPMQIIS